MAVSVREVEGAAELEAFLDLPLRLHGHDPHFVAPLRPWLRRRLSPRNAFLREGHLRLLVARRGAELVGTISVLLDARHNAHRGEALAFFGFLETEDDPEVLDALLAAACAQARAWGADRLRGGRNLTRFEDPGILVEGFESRPPMLSGHHPPYYARRLEEAGFVKHHDLLAYARELYESDGTPSPLPEPLASKAAAVDIPGLVIRPVRWTRIARDLDLAHQVLNTSYASVPETSPMPRDQFVQLGRIFLLLTSRHMLQLATVGDEAVGFAVCVPEINEAIQAAGGRVLPLGWWRMLLAARRMRTAGFKLIGVVPEHRGTGVHARLIEAAIEGVRRAGYTRLDASLIDERNEPMRRVVEGAGCTPYRRYRFYERPL